VWSIHLFSARAENLQGRTNISLRKGDREKTVGPYDDYTWDYIISLVADNPDSGKARKHVEETQRKLGFLRTIQIWENCVYAVDGYCLFWVYEEARLEGCIRVKPRPVPGKEGKVHVKANPVTCMGCTAYDAGSRKPMTSVKG